MQTFELPVGILQYKIKRNCSQRSSMIFSESQELRAF